jgi:dihydrofolate reductase
MAKVQYYCAATLDGFIADPDDGLGWLLDYEGSYEGPEAEPGPMGEGGSYEPFYKEVGALVSGSTTYEWVLDKLEEWPYAGKPCWVLSSRDLRKPEGSEDEVRIVDAQVEEIHEQVLESAGDRNVWILGGGNVASQYAAAGLLDELLLTVVPVVLAEGKPLFAEPVPGGPLKLTGTTVHRTGMVELRYELPRPAQS